MTAANVLAGQQSWHVEQADAIDFLGRLSEESVDLIFGSPPYAGARTYGIDVTYGCQEWVDWMLQITEAAVRVSKGLVLWVAAGVQRDKCYWPTCEGLTWEWWKRGNQLWRPCVWWKVDEQDGGTGIPGSGGKQWLRNDWEYVLAFKKKGWLPWADNTARGHEPVYASVGGEMSNRKVDGHRINARVERSVKDRRKRKTYHAHPERVNPGNVLPCVVKARVGGGHIGSKLAHEGEAPFPEKLAEFFVVSFCPPGGIVCDVFSGSGTTAAVCKRNGRNFVGCDLRQSQVELTGRRLAQETPSLFVNQEEGPC